MVRKVVSTWLFAVLALGLFGAACTKKPKSYTLENVNAELNARQKEIVSLRKQGKLEKSANLALRTGRDILNVYPPATMYREEVAKVVSVMGFLARICTDKALHIRNESMKPEDSRRFTKLSDDLYAMIDDIRKKMPSMLSNKKPEIKKVTPNSGEDDDPPGEAGGKVDPADSTSAEDPASAEEKSEEKPAKSGKSGKSAKSGKSGK